MICQFVWGVYCFLHSPYNIMLSFLNVALIGISVASYLSPDNDELLFQHAYIATWVIPAVIVIFYLLVGQFEIENFALAKVGAPTFNPLIEGSSTAYSTVLHNYLISQLIVPSFRVTNWMLRFFWGHSND